MPRLLKGVEAAKWAEEVERFFPFASRPPRPFEADDSTPAPDPKALAAVTMNHTISSFALFRLMVKFEVTAKNSSQKPPPSESFRAELIDVSVPRRDTIEAVEQWAHTRGQIVPVDGIPVPNFWYYLDEYVLMTREVYAGTSRSARKFGKRLRRGHMLGMATEPTFVKLLAERVGNCKAGGLPQTGAAIEAEPVQANRAAMLTLASQFWGSYRLHRDPGLKGQVDRALAATFAAVSKKKAAGAAGYAYSVWAGHLVGRAIRAHLAVRAEQLEWRQRLEANEEPNLTPADARTSRASNFEALVKALHTALAVLLRPSAFDRYDQEVRIAVSGASAAQLHLGARNPLPQSCLEVVVLCGDADAGPIPDPSAPKSEEDEEEKQNAKKRKREEDEPSFGSKRSKLTGGGSVSRQRVRAPLMKTPGAVWGFVRELLKDYLKRPESIAYELWPEAFNPKDPHLYLLWPEKIKWPDAEDGGDAAWPDDVPWKEEELGARPDAAIAAPAAFEPYRPVFARLRFVDVRRSMPELSFIGGFPVRTLRDLIQELEEEAAHATEFDRVQALEEAIGRLKARLTGGEVAPVPRSWEEGAPAFADPRAGEDDDEEDDGVFVGWHGTCSAHRESLSKGLEEVDGSWADLELGQGFYVATTGPAAYAYGCAAVRSWRAKHPKEKAEVEVDLWKVTCEVPLDELQGAGVPNDEQYDRKENLQEKYGGNDYLWNALDVDKTQIKFNARAFSRLRLKRVQSVSERAANVLADEGGEPPGRPRRSSKPAKPVERPIVPCVGDGDCFFHAVAFHVKASPEVQEGYRASGRTYGRSDAERKDTLAVRQEIAGWLREHLYADVDLTTLTALGREHETRWKWLTRDGADTAHFGASLQEHVKRLTSPSAIWGDPSLLGLAVVTLYDRPLVIYNPPHQPQRMDGKWNPEQERFEKRGELADEAPIRVQYNGHDHYSVRKP